MRTQRHVKVPAEYFRKAKSEYADWVTAWWREVIQNAVDAGATRLEATVEKRADENPRQGCFVRFRDNGRGMSQETLLNTFLALGGSEKPDGAIGGFGYAKNLIAFAHNRYTIATGVERVEGRGGDYEHFQVDAAEAMKGVSIDVDIDDDQIDSYSFAERLQALLNASKLPRNLEFWLNGEKITPRTPEMPFKTRTELGPLQFRDAKYAPSKLWVRMGGLAMFPVTVWTHDSHFQGVLDLNGSSLEMLTSNRDSLRADKQQKLQTLVQELATERGKLKCKDLLDLTLNFESTPLELPAAATAPDDMSVDELAAQLQEFAEETALQAGAGDEQPARTGIRATSVMTDEQIAQVRARRATQGAEGALPLTEMRVTGPAAGAELAAFRKLAEKRMTTVDKLRQRLRQLDTTGYPRSFRIRTAEMGAESRRDPAAAYTPIFKKLEQARVQRLARAWEATVKAVLQQPFCSMRGIDWKEGRPFKDDKPINTGFVFSDQLEGLHVPHPDGAIDILLNPDVMPKLDVEDLLDIALHEVTHIWVGGHHEGFTTTESHLRKGMRKFMPVAELKRVVRDALEVSGPRPAAAPATPAPAMTAERPGPVERPSEPVLEAVPKPAVPTGEEQPSERRRAPAPF